MKNKQKFKDSLGNLQKALSRLEEAIRIPIQNDRDLAGIIKHFEFVYELSWLTLKRYLVEEGRVTSTPKNVLQVAYEIGLISDEKTWLEIMEDRNETVHTYDEDFAKAMVKRITNKYVVVFQMLLKKLKKNG